MYTIHIGTKLLYSPDTMDKAHMVLNPHLSMQVNEAGTLTFTIPPQNTAYDGAQKLKSIITVEQDGVEIWRGRIISDERDFYKQRKVTCEGDLAFLKDSVARPYEYNATSVSGYLTQMLANHNPMVSTVRRFSVGSVGYTDTWDAFSESHARTLDELEANLTDVLGGYLMTRKTDDGYVLDYIKNTGRANCSQTIEFGKNLLDLKEYIDATEVYTMLIPVGTDADGNEVSIASVNNGLDYVQDDAAISLFGKMWTFKEFHDVESPQDLLTKANAYLAKLTDSALTITINAVDLHLLDVNTGKIKLGDAVRVVSEPHGMDKRLVCTQIDLDMVNPDKTTYTLGIPTQTLTERQKKAATKDEVSDVTSTSKTKVSKGKVISAVNASKEADIINALKVDIDGAVVIKNLKSDMIEVKDLVANTIQFQSGAGYAISVNVIRVQDRPFVPKTITLSNGSNCTVLAVP